MTLKKRLASKIGRAGDIMYRKITGILEKRRTNGTDMGIGWIVTGYGETDPDIDVCENGEVPLGPIYGPAESEIDLSVDGNVTATNCFADNTWVNVWIMTSGEEGYLLCQTDITYAVTKDHDLCVTGGKLSNYIYVNATEATDRNPAIMWVALEGEAAGTTQDLFCLCRRV